MQKHEYDSQELVECDVGEIPTTLAATTKQIVAMHIKNGDLDWLDDLVHEALYIEKWEGVDAAVAKVEDY